MRASPTPSPPCSPIASPIRRRNKPTTPLSARTWRAITLLSGPYVIRASDPLPSDRRAASVHLFACKPGVLNSVTGRIDQAGRPRRSLRDRFSRRPGAAPLARARQLLLFRKRVAHARDQRSDDARPVDQSGALAKRSFLLVSLRQEIDTVLKSQDDAGGKDRRQTPGATGPAPPARRRASHHPFETSTRKRGFAPLLRKFARRHAAPRALMAASPVLRDTAPPTPRPAPRAPRRRRQAP